MKLASVLTFLILLTTISAFSQTSWKGTSSTDWGRATNWTNGIPTSTSDVIIGDANFTGANQPTINRSSTCKSLTIGTSIKVSTLTVGRALSVSGIILIGSNGTIIHATKASISLTGNWTNLGVYNPTAANAAVTFSGTSQSITGPTTFKTLTINAGSTTTLNASITVTHLFSVNGTLDPNESPSYTVSGNGKTDLNSSGTLIVKASSFAGNYALTGPQNFSGGSTVDFASSTINQSISNSTAFANLRISGGLVKTLTGNISGLKGNLTVVAGTLDLSTFSANHGGGAGTFTVANGATLKIGGNNTFPSAYTTHSLGGLSTVEYSGRNQVVSPEAYGNLIFSSSTGAAIKTMPASAMTIAGDLTSNLGAGTSVAFTAGAAITVNGNVTLGASTTFDGGSFAHSVGGNWTNNGTFTGSTSTIKLSGLNKSISGAGTNNFNNITITGAGVTAAASTNMTVSGNFAATGAGTFTHATGSTGAVAMTGSAKTIAGSGIIFNNLLAFGTTSTSASLTIAGDLWVNGTLTCNGGTVTMSGPSNNITGNGTITLYILNVSGSISTAKSFTINSDLSVSGTLTAVAGTVTFAGTSALSGTANLVNVSLNGTRLQLGSGSVLGIAGALTLTSGLFDVTATTPNTVNYNSSAAQTITAAQYNNLSLSGGGTKTAGGALTVNGDLAINPGVSFDGGFSTTHAISGNWINNGTFIANTSAIQFTGGSDASVSGATAFNGLTLNKNSSSNILSLNSSVSVSTLTMTTGTMHTGANSVTVTSTRTGSGIIIGTIIRTHAFSDGTAYAFEGQDNTITFNSGGSSVSSVTVTVSQAPVADFVFGGSINREYNIDVSSAGSYTAGLRLHYEDAELNGNTESGMKQWHFNGALWALSGETAHDTVNNWVEQSTLASIQGRWSLCEPLNVVSWTGLVSSDWGDGGNWKNIFGIPNIPPQSTDIVVFGDTAFGNQPLITTPVTVKNMIFGSAQATTLFIGGGSLTTNGNVIGSWVSAASHTIQIGSQSLTIGGDIVVSDGTIGHAINLMIGSGSVQVVGSLTQSGDAIIASTGGGDLTIGGNFNYAGGTFSGGTGTTTYNGTSSQIVAGGISYNDLVFNKASGTATLSAPATVNGALQLSNGGTFLLGASLAVAGNVGIGTGATLDGNAYTLSVAGDWSRTGTFTPATGTVAFNGSGSQSIGSTTFNDLTVNKTSGTVSPSGNLSLNGDLTITGGTLDLLGFTANRNAIGGALTLSGVSTLKVSGVNNFPGNFAIINMASSSNVEYNGTLTQVVAPVPYGNLIFSNGGSNVKAFSGSTTIAGDLLISTGATLDGGTFSASIAGNWTNGGTFIPSGSSITLTGTSKFIDKNTTFNDLTISGSYTGASNIIVNGAMFISGAYQANGTTTTFSGGFTNIGSFMSGGSVLFSGGLAQTLEMNSGFNSSGTVNFNGSVSPVFADLTVPALANVNISNTAGVAPNVGWTVGGTFIVANGSTFNAGFLTHTFGATFTNNGTVTNVGTFNFDPSAPATLTFLGTSFAGGGIMNFGGTADITVAGGAPTFSSVNVTNTGAGGVTPISSWTVTGDLFIGDGSTLNGGPGLTHTISGNWTNNGTYNAGTSTVILNNSLAGSIGGSGTTTFDNLTIAGIITAVSDFNVEGNFADNGTFDGTGVNVAFTGNGPSSIGGTSAPLPFDQVTVAKNSATTTLAANLTGLTTVTVAGGTLDLSTFSVSQNVTGGILILAPLSTLKIGGSATMPAFTSFDFDLTSVVEYNGTGSQAVSEVPAYGALVFSNSGTKTPPGSLTVLGDFSFVGGVFTGGSFTHSFGGNWTMTGGTFSNTATTIEFSGSGAQVISSTGAFSGVTLNKPSGSCSLGTDVTIDGALTFTQGNIITGPHTVIVGTAGSVSRTSGHVVGNLQKPIPAGATAATYEIGDVSNFAPVSVSFANVISSGTLTASTTGSEHPNVSASGINSGQDLNRYWTLTNGGTVFTTCNANFNFVPGDVDSGADLNNFAIRKLDSTMWTAAAVGVRTATSLEATGVTSFSDFTAGVLIIDTIFATAGPHGSISPSGSIPVISGQSQAFTITPDPTYFVTDVQIDSTSDGDVGVYTFSNVTRNHAIKASFGVNPRPHVISISPSAGFRGETMDLVVTGSNFIGGVSTLDASPGIAINNFNVHTPDSLFANVTISATASLGVKSFSVTNSPPGGTSGSAGFTVINRAPAVFTLAQPANGDTIQLTSVPHPITFTWHSSSDLDVNDTLTYILHIPGITAGDSIQVRMDSSVSANIMDRLAPDSTYTWSVSVTDGFDTVVSAAAFTFRTSSTVTGVSDPGNGIPKEYALQQNYPNPFNPLTTIEYALPQRSRVVLIIYNVLGNEVVTLMNGIENAGQKSVRFDASNLSSGVYFYRLLAEDVENTGSSKAQQFTQVRKMLFVK